MVHTDTYDCSAEYRVYPECRFLCIHHTGVQTHTIVNEEELHAQVFYAQNSIRVETSISIVNYQVVVATSTRTNPLSPIAP